MGRRLASARGVAVIMSPLLSIALALATPATAPAHAASGTCTAFTCRPGLLPGFGPCRNGERSMFFYTETADKAKACPATKKFDISAVHGLDCNLRCPAGTFLSANRTFNPVTHRPHWASSCESCPTGQFSLGGGRIYSGMTGAWNGFPAEPIEFHTNCMSKRDGVWQRGHCEPWQAGPNGTYIHSGNNSGMDNEATVSTLHMNANFVRDGYVKFSIRVDAEECSAFAVDPRTRAKFEAFDAIEDDAQSGVSPPRCGDGLDFVLDVSLKGQRYAYEPEWWLVKKKIPRGSHTLKWEFTKDGSVDQGMDQAQIALIEVVGTGHADKECTPCAFAASNGGKNAAGAGSSSADDDRINVDDLEWDDLKYTNGGAVSEHCASCPAPDANGDFWYADTDEYKHPCIKCPPGTYSVAGKNIGYRSCLLRPSCTMEDMVRNHTVCDRNGQRRRFYSWVQPRSCIAKGEKEASATALDLKSPDDAGKTFKCPDCDAGYFTPVGSHAGTCEPCPQGKYRGDAHDPNTCKTCGAGAVVHRSFQVAGDSSSAGVMVDWSQWPAGFIVPAALSEGWQLSADGIVSAAQHFSYDSTDALLLRTSIPESWDSAHGTRVAFEFEIQFMPKFAWRGSFAELSFSVNGQAIEVPGGRLSYVLGKTCWAASTSGQPIAHDASCEKASSSAAAAAIRRVVVTRASGDLRPGALVLEWRFTRTSMPWGSAERVLLRKLELHGTRLGGAASCVSCQPGYAPDKDQADCTRCAPGRFSARSGDLCEECPPGKVTASAIGGASTRKAGGATSCTPCGAFMAPSADGSECVVSDVSADVPAGVSASPGTRRLQEADTGGESQLQKWERWAVGKAKGVINAASRGSAEVGASVFPKRFEYDMEALRGLGNGGGKGAMHSPFAHDGTMVEARDVSACPPEYPILTFSDAGRTSRCYSKDMKQSCNYEGKLAADPTGLQPNAKWSRVKGAKSCGTVDNPCPPDYPYALLHPVTRKMHCFTQFDGNATKGASQPELALMCNVPRRSSTPSSGSWGKLKGFKECRAVNRYRRIFYVSTTARGMPSVGRGGRGGGWVNGMWQPGGGGGGSSKKTPNRVTQPPVVRGGAFAVELVDRRVEEAERTGKVNANTPVQKRIPGFGAATCRPTPLYGAVQQFVRFEKVEVVDAIRCPAGLGGLCQTLKASAAAPGNKASSDGDSHVPVPRPPAGLRLTFGGAMMSRQDATEDSASRRMDGSTPAKDKQVELLLICDPAATKGATQPLFIAETKHMLYFQWRTVVACPVCHTAFFELRRTECIEGTRTARYLPTVPCYAGDAPHTSATQRHLAAIVEREHAGDVHSQDSDSVGALSTVAGVMNASLMAKAAGKEWTLGCKEVVVTRKMALWFTLTMGVLGALMVVLLCYLLYLKAKHRNVYAKYQKLRTEVEQDGSTSFEFEDMNEVADGKEDDEDYDTEDV